MSTVPVKELLTLLVDRGVSLNVSGTSVRVEAPVGVLDPDLKARLRDSRGALREHLQRGDQILQASLAEFEKSHLCLEVRVPGFTEALWFVSCADGVEKLWKEGAPRGRIWTGRELRDLVTASGVTHVDVIRLAQAKLVFNAEVVDVRPDDSEVSPSESPAFPVPAEPVQQSLGLDARPSREFD